MTTPAGWYDDGSGNRRWWDGDQWTPHVVHSAHPTVEAPGFAPAASARTVSVPGLIGVVAAGVGLVLACIPPIAPLGWIVLGLAFVVSVVSLFLRGSKWPGITGLGLTTLGALAILAVSLVTLGVNTIVEAGESQSAPTERPSIDGESSTGDGPAAPAEDPSNIEGVEMVSFDELAKGDCLPLVEYEEEIFELPVIACDRPHTDEVYFVYEFDDAEYPGDDVLFEAAEQRCLAEFETFVGTPYEQSELDFYEYWPTQMSWNRMNDRTVHCIVFSYDDVTGTLEGAGR